jgi:hypothetical protein
MLVPPQLKRSAGLGPGPVQDTAQLAGPEAGAPVTVTPENFSAGAKRTARPARRNGLIFGKGNRVWNFSPPPPPGPIRSINYFFERPRRFSAPFLGPGRLTVGKWAGDL